MYEPFFKCPHWKPVVVGYSKRTPNFYYTGRYGHFSQPIYHPRWKVWQICILLTRNYRKQCLCNLSFQKIILTMFSYSQEGYSMISPRHRFCPCNLIQNFFWYQHCHTFEKTLNPLHSNHRSHRWSLGDWNAINPFNTEVYTIMLVCYVTRIGTDSSTIFSVLGIWDYNSYI